MSFINALSGLVSELLDTLAEKVAGTEKHQETARTVTQNYLTLDPKGRALIAKLARSEVKNYLAELAEQAGLPFGGPAEFVRNTARKPQELVFHGADCPGHTTGLPGKSCLEVSDATV